MYSYKFCKNIFYADKNFKELILYSYYILFYRFLLQDVSILHTTKKIYIVILKIVRTRELLKKKETGNNLKNNER